MARKVIYVCDHCGKEFESTNGYIEHQIDAFNFYEEVDLCTECFNEIDNIVREFCKLGKE